MKKQKNKSNQEMSKLSFSKFQIAKIENPQVIWGGNDTGDRTVDTQE